MIDSNARWARLVASMTTLVLFATLALGQSQDAKKSHTLHGKVEVVHATAKSLTLNHGKVEGWG